MPVVDPGRYLSARGKRRVGGATANDERSLMRLDGLCAEYGRGLPVFEVAALSTANGGHRAAAELLAGDPELDAICCSSDQLALGAIAELRSRGLRVPHDGTATIEDTGWEIFRPLLDVASGRRTWAERWELHNALALFNPAPVT